VIDWCRDSLYSISDQIEVLDDIPCSVSDVHSQVAEVEVRMISFIIEPSGDGFAVLM